MSLDAAHLAAIRERLAAATAGPWLPCSCGKCGLVFPASDGDNIICDTHGWRDGDGPENPNKIADHMLISHAPTDLADLLAAHEALTAQVAALREALEWVAQHRTYDKEHMERPLKDTAAAAEAFKRQQRLEGARELVRDMGGYPGTEHIALADMERDESA